MTIYQLISSINYNLPKNKKQLKKIVLFGAGKSASVLIDYLLGQATENNWKIIVADANKKLEGQLKRIGELESMLNMVAEERDELAKKHFNS